MPCYHPLRAYAVPGGVTFKSPATHDGAPIDLPCGQCIGCRIQRSRDWAVRITHEAQMHPANCFLTLTYSDETQPPTLVYRDFQLFLKKLRKSHEPNRLRFFMVGEYGSQSQRAHFHACIFNLDFADKLYHSKSDSGHAIYTSATLSKLWPHGFANIGQVTAQSAAYCARYIMAKKTGDLAADHYGNRLPEFNKMSLNPGIGASWLAKFRTDLFPCDYVVNADGHKDRVPAYYDKLNKRHNARELAHVKDDRIQRQTPESRADNTPSRLAAKEVVHAAALSLLTRQL